MKKEIANYSKPRTTYDPLHEIKEVIKINNETVREIIYKNYEESPKTERINLKMNPRMKRDLEEFSRKRGFEVSEVLRVAIMEILRKR